VIACLRVLPAGLKYPEASLGRVVTSPEARRTGLGRDLMAEALRRLESTFGSVPVRISAQAYLEKFYGEFGFKRVTENYLEDDIPHCEMLRS
jgi:ElaA protein